MRLILAIQALRAFLYGFGTVVLGTELAAGGFSVLKASTVFTAMLAGMAISSIAVGLRGDRIGRRRLYLRLLLVMGAAGTVFALTDSFPALIIAALTGTMSTDPNESGPITSIEQAMLGHAPKEARATVFGRYNAVAYLAGAVGALAAGGPAAFRQLLPALPADQKWLLAFPLGGAICAGLASRLSDAVEADDEGRGGSAERGWTGKRSTAVPALRHSRRIVTRLAALFAIDSFAGGFVVQTFLVFWFHRKFGASTELMSLVFFCAGLLQAGSSIAAGWLGGRIGLLNTMVFTHLPSNVLLLLVPFMPSIGLAIAVLLARFALSQMDVPTRQAYVVAMVDPGERTAAAAFTNTARYVVRPAGPVAAGALMQATAIGGPFVVAGGLKILYDLLLFGTFRRVRLPESSPKR